MADVARFVRDIQEVVYTVGPDSVRRAILSWLTDEHNAAFTDTTAIRFCAGDSIAVTTRFASGMEAPPGGETEQIAENANCSGSTEGDSPTGSEAGETPKQGCP
jgi:predicted phage gp36 major capsid-like protein